MCCMKIENENSAHAVSTFQFKNINIKRPNSQEVAPSKQRVIAQ